MGEIKGINVARTIPLNLTPNHIPRNSLLEFFSEKNNRLIILHAPSGYGKSSLMAEWASRSGANVFWFSASKYDSTKEYAEHIIQAMRNQIPDFAINIENDPTATPADIVNLIAATFHKIKNEITVFIDNTDETAHDMVHVFQKYIDIIPENVQTVASMRNEMPIDFSRYVKKGSMVYLGLSALQFAPSEITELINRNGLTEDTDFKEYLKTLSGWPAAVSLATKHYKKESTFHTVNTLSSAAEAVNLLLESVLGNLSSTELANLILLSKIDEFDFETANAILDTNNAQEFLLLLASQGLIVIRARFRNRKYSISEFVKEKLLNKSHLVSDNTHSEMHKRLASFYREKGLTEKAVEAGMRSGDAELVTQILVKNVRQLNAAGHGERLLAISKVLLDGSEEGNFKGKLVAAFGNISSGNFAKAKALLSEIHHLYGAYSPEWVNHNYAIGNILIAFAKGSFSEMREHLNVLISEKDIPSENLKSDIIVALRIHIASLVISQRYSEVSELVLIAEELARGSREKDVYFNLSAIRCMHLFAEGKLNQCLTLGLESLALNADGTFGGLQGSIDLNFVIAKIYIELFENSLALDYLKSAELESEKWSIAAWNCAIKCEYANLHFIKSKVHGAFSLLKDLEQKVLIKSLSSELLQFVRLTEIALRIELKDVDKAYSELKDFPQSPIRNGLLLKVQRKRRDFRNIQLNDFRKEGTVRDKIENHLLHASVNIDNESLAISHLRNALALAGENQIFRTVVTFDDAFSPLIYKIATLFPSFFLEQISSFATGLSLGNGLDVNGGHSKLTNRELEILRNLGGDFTIESIASNLHISINTMKTHLKNIYKKLEADNRKDAVRIATDSFIIS